MPHGVVILFDNHELFGEIDPEGSEGSMPFHFDDILVDEDEEPTFPQVGSKVEYEVKEDAGAKHAVKIKVHPINE